MSVAFTVDISGPAIRFLDQVEAGLQPGPLKQRIGGVAQRLTQRHLRAINAARPNQLGGARTNFYGNAAQATTFTAAPDGVLITIAKQGMRQRFSGGTITPVNAKYLTIPATAAAHGKRAGEFGDLKFTIVPGKGPALVRKATVTKNTGRKRKDGTYAQKVLVQEGDVVFWLRRRVTQRPDPTVLPNEQDFASAISADLNVWINTLRDRAANN